MGRGNRQVEACIVAMENGVVSDTHFRAILKHPDSNVQPLVRFLKSEVPMVRLVAAKIISALGDVSSVLNAALMEEDREVLVGMLRALGERGEGLDALDEMVCRDSIIREEAIRMYRTAGRVDTLASLLFSKDDYLVSRIKRYVKKQEREEGTGS